MNEFWGYKDLGPVRVPPEAQYLGITDRDTGVIWYLAYDPCWGCRLALVTADKLPPTKVQTTRVLGPYDSPWLTNGIRLGVRNGRMLFDMAVSNQASEGEVFSLNGSGALWMQLYPKSQSNPNRYDHLAYDGLPSVFCGLQDRATGAIWYVALDDTTGRLSLISELPMATGTVRARLKIFYGNDGPAVGTGGQKLGVRNGRLLWELGTNQSVIYPLYGFNSLGKADSAAQLLPGWLNRPAGVADVPPDHVQFQVVDPITNECPGGPQTIEAPSLVLATDEGGVIEAEVSGTIATPD